MNNRKNNIKSMIELYIANIDEFDSPFVTYKASSIQCLFKDTLNLIKGKEQECEAQRYKLDYYITKTTQLLDNIDSYKQALNEIRQYRVAEINDEDEEETDTILKYIDAVIG